MHAFAAQTQRWSPFFEPYFLWLVFLLRIVIISTFLYSFVWHAAWLPGVDESVLEPVKRCNRVLFFLRRPGSTLLLGLQPPSQLRCK